MTLALQRETTDKSMQKKNINAKTEKKQMWLLKRNYSLQKLFAEKSFLFKQKLFEKLYNVVLRGYKNPRDHEWTQGEYFTNLNVYLCWLDT